MKAQRELTLRQGLPMIDEGPELEPSRGLFLQHSNQLWLWPCYQGDSKEQPVGLGGGP